MVRTPAVAGQFYPDDPAVLAAQLKAYLKPEGEPKPALLAVSPHAGYVYSGAVAGRVLSRVKVPARVVVAGPNHRGMGAQAAIMSQGAWQTPLGQVGLDQALGEQLKRETSLVEEDPQAHRLEHSLEVQVPFLQALRPDLKLLPLCLGHLSFAHCRDIGQALARAIRAQGEPVLMVASTDMTHYESAGAAKQKDSRAIERILALDPQGLYDTVRGLGISMCGVLPTTVCLVAALELGAAQAELVAYAHSGMVTGDDREVVGYAGLLVS
jgi:AmmeMemoRadiSam system protein B